LLFELGGRMERVFQALIDRSRAPLDLDTVKTILGYQRRPKYRTRKRKSAEWEVALEKPTYDLNDFPPALREADVEDLYQRRTRASHRGHGA
jgi:hypothetical protein